MFDAFRAISWEAAAGPASPRAHTNAHTQTQSRMTTTSESSRSFAPPRSRELRSEPLLAARDVVPRKAQEHVDHLRVELRPRALAQPPARLVHREALPVRPVGRHRVEGVADEDDPRLDRNLVAGLAVGIAVAVPALVAGAD